MKNRYDDLVFGKLYDAQIKELNEIDEDWEWDDDIDEPEHLGWDIFYAPGEEEEFKGGAISTFEEIGSDDGIEFNGAPEDAHWSKWHSKFIEEKNILGDLMEWVFISHNEHDVFKLYQEGFTPSEALAQLSAIDSYYQVAC